MASSAAKLFGCVVMTRKGVPLWQGWLFKPSAQLQTKPLCMAVSQVFARQPDQDSSFISTGQHAVASVMDGDYIVAVVCSSSCPEPEILMKAKELAHNAKLLFGSMQVTRLAQQRPEDLAAMLANTSMLELFHLCYEAEAEATDAAEGAYDADIGDWIKQHGTNDQLQSFFISKLKLLSPCEDCFQQLSQVSGFVCAQLVDLSEPGEVLLEYWQQAAGSGQSVPPDAPVIEMLEDHSSSLWTLMLREAKITLAKSRQASVSPMARASLSSLQGAQITLSTLDLSAFGAKLKASIRLLDMKEYDPAFVVVYKGDFDMPGPPAGGRAAFRVSYDEDVVPGQVLAKLTLAHNLLRAKFPDTRQQLLESIWPELASGNQSAMTALAGFAYDAKPIPAQLPLPSYMTTSPIRMGPPTHKQLGQPGPGALGSQSASTVRQGLLAPGLSAGQEQGATIQGDTVGGVERGPDGGRPPALKTQGSLPRAQSRRESIASAPETPTAAFNNVTAAVTAAAAAPAAEAPATGVGGGAGPAPRSSGVAAKGKGKSRLSSMIGSIFGGSDEGVGGETDASHGSAKQLSKAKVQPGQRAGTRSELQPRLSPAGHQESESGDTLRQWPAPGVTGAAAGLRQQGAGLQRDEAGSSSLSLEASVGGAGAGAGAGAPAGRASDGATFTPGESGSLLSVKDSFAPGGPPASPGATSPAATPAAVALGPARSAMALRPPAVATQALGPMSWLSSLMGKGSGGDTDDEVGSPKSRTSPPLIFSAGKRTGQRRNIHAGIPATVASPTAVGTAQERAPAAAGGAALEPPGAAGDLARPGAGGAAAAAGNVEVFGSLGGRLSDDASDSSSDLELPGISVGPPKRHQPVRVGPGTHIAQPRQEGARQVGRPDRSPALASPGVGTAAAPSDSVIAQTEPRGGIGAIGGSLDHGQGGGAGTVQQQQKLQQPQQGQGSGRGSSSGEWQGLSEEDGEERVKQQLATEKARRDEQRDVALKKREQQIREEEERQRVEEAARVGREGEWQAGGMVARQDVGDKVQVRGKKVVQKQREQRQRAEKQQEEEEVTKVQGRADAEEGVRRRKEEESAVLERERRFPEEEQRLQAKAEDEARRLEQEAKRRQAEAQRRKLEAAAKAEEERRLADLQRVREREEQAREEERAEGVKRQQAQDVMKVQDGQRYNEQQQQQQQQSQQQAAKLPDWLLPEEPQSLAPAPQQLVQQQPLNLPHHQGQHGAAATVMSALPAGVTALATVAQTTAPQITAPQTAALASAAPSDSRGGKAAVQQPATLPEPSHQPSPPKLTPATPLKPPNAAQQPSPPPAKPRALAQPPPPASFNASHSLASPHSAQAPGVVPSPPSQPRQPGHPSPVGRLSLGPPASGPSQHQSPRTRRASLAPPCNPNWQQQQQQQANTVRMQIQGPRPGYPVMSPAAQPVPPGVRPGLTPSPPRRPASPARTPRQLPGYGSLLQGFSPEQIAANRRLSLQPQRRPADAPAPLQGGEAREWGRGSPAAVPVRDRLSLGPHPQPALSRQQQLWSNLATPLSKHRAAGEMAALRQQVSRWDLQLRREREMRDWVGGDGWQAPVTAGGAAAAGGKDPGGVEGASLHKPVGADGPGKNGGWRADLFDRDRPRPVAVWQLFNGEWYRLYDDGEWLPAAGGPMVAAGAAELDGQEEGQEAGWGQGGQGVGGWGLAGTKGRASAEAAWGGRGSTQAAADGMHGLNETAGVFKGAKGPEHEGRWQTAAAAKDRGLRSDRRRTASPSTADWPVRGMDDVSASSCVTSITDEASATPPRRHRNEVHGGKRHPKGNSRSRHSMSPGREVLGAGDIQAATITATATAAAVAAASAPVAAGVAIQVWQQIQQQAAAAAGQQQYLPQGMPAVLSQAFGGSLGAHRTPPAAGQYGVFTSSGGAAAAATTPMHQHASGVGGTGRWSPRSSPVSAQTYAADAAAAAAWQNPALADAWAWSQQQQQQSSWQVPSPGPTVFTAGLGKHAPLPSQVDSTATAPMPPAVSMPTGSSYYQGPEGEVYCYAGGSWFLMPASTASSTVTWATGAELGAGQITAAGSLPPGVRKYPATKATALGVGLARQPDAQQQRFMPLAILEEAAESTG